MNTLFRLPVRSRSLLLAILFLSGSFTAICQSVNCVNTLDSVKNYMEKNYVGFADKATAAKRKAYYQERTRKAFSYARRARSRSDYYFTIDYWLQFFKDHHVYMTIPADTTLVETISLNEKQLGQLAKQPALAIEGIYYFRDSTYKVAVIKSKKGLRSFAGVVLESRARTWKPGQVKFELIETGNNEYQGVYYLRNHAPYFGTVRFDKKNGLAVEGWLKQGVAMPVEQPVKPLFEEERKANAFYKILNDSTGYMRIQSFDLAYARGIDSVIQANLKSIQSMPRFIIDLRYNGGGGDHSMSFLKPIIYTNPVKQIGADLVITPDNIIDWERLLYKYRNELPKKDYDFIMGKLDQGRGKERTTVVFDEDRIDTLPGVWALPNKVAIVINHGCGSSTEEFLLFAQQSKKVVMAGTSSIGGLDYSNVVQKDFYSPAFTLTYPTTRSRRIDIGEGIDNIGVQPDIPLDLSNNNWLNELLKKF